MGTEKRWMAVGALLAAGIALCACGCRKDGGPARSQSQEREFVDDIGFESKYDFDPKQADYRGIPIGDFSGEWASFEVMSFDSMPARLAALVKDNGLSVQVDKDLDKDGAAERVICGVYRDKKNATGDFVAVLKGSKVAFASTWNKRARLPHMKAFENGVFFGNGFGSEYFAYLAYEGGGYVIKDANEE
jgi:hypothetical protein